MSLIRKQHKKEAKLRRDYERACDMINIMVNEITPSPWSKPTSSGIWNGNFENTLKAVSYNR